MSFVLSDTPLGSIIPGSDVTSIATIIPRMLFGILLIILWLPVIIFTEKNNKGNDEENALLLEKIDTNLKLTNVTNKTIYKEIDMSKLNISTSSSVTSSASTGVSTSGVVTTSTSNASTSTPSISRSTNNTAEHFDSSTSSISNKDITMYPEGFVITNDFIKSNNNNIYYTSKTVTTTTNDKGKKTTMTTPGNSIILQNILIDGQLMNEYNYDYLVKLNKVYSTTIQDKNDNNIKYNIEMYSIPAGKELIKVEGLQEFENELDMQIFNYEFGPEEAAINTIKTRKENKNKFQRWAGRIGTFLMLFIGLGLLVSPLQYMVGLGSSLPFPLSIMAIPGQIIVSIYNSLSFIGSLILTVLMTFFIWSIINYPMIAVLVGGLLAGFIIYFKKHKIIK